MASKTHQRKRLRQLLSHTDVDDGSDTDVMSVGDGGEGLALSKRQATVYDAVAGRVTTTLPISNFYDLQRSRVKHHRQPATDSRRDPTLAPEEVLFKRAGAPVRYAEKDIYQAHEDLPDGGQGILPDSEMLKSIHSYVSRFYADLPANRQAISTETRDNISERSMDETALLAFGILLEEAGREALGRKGDLVFTEGVGLERRGEIQGEDGDGDGSGHEDVEVFGFKDALRYEARGRRMKQAASGRDGDEVTTV